MFSLNTLDSQLISDPFHCYILIHLLPVYLLRGPEAVNADQGTSLVHLCTNICIIPNFRKILKNVIEP